MKKFLIAIALIIIPIGINAQPEKGTKVLEGNFSYSSTTNEDYYTFNYSTTEYSHQQLAFRPKIGWFVSAKSALGVGVGYEFNQYESSHGYPNEIKRNLFSVSPYFRNYQKITDKLYYTTTIYLALGFGNETRHDRETDTFEADMFSVSIGAQPGLSYFLSDKWALKANFGRLYYSKTTREISEGFGDEKLELTDKNFGFNFSMDSFSLGIGYYF